MAWLKDLRQRLDLGARDDKARTVRVTLLTALFVLSVTTLYMGLVQFSTPDLPGNDGYYHIKMAYLMRTEGLKPDFPWLPLTILNPREFYNHHFLFHVLLIPFTLGDLILGAKWATILFASLSFTALWRLLDAQRIPYATMWALALLAVSEAFIGRMSIARAQSLSLAFLVLALHCLLQGRHKVLFVLGFVYVWTYNAFPLLLGIVGAYVAAKWLVETRLDLRPLVYSGLGIVAGSIVNPYFPYNLIFVYQHIVPKLLDPTTISVGSEWYPYTTGQLLSHSPLALLVFVSAILPLGLSRRRIDVHTTTGFLLAVLFGWMLFRSRRFIEYFPAFSLIFAAFAWAPLLATQQGARMRAESSTMAASRWPRAGRVAMVVVGVAFLLISGGSTLQRSRVAMRASKPHEMYAGAAGWLMVNTSSGERVFQTDWDDFTRLFFHNTHNTYLVGLDPTYMQLYDAALYDAWVDLTRGRVEEPSRMIVDHFGARYVMSDLLHEGFLDQAERDPRLIEVYRDDDAVIYQVGDE